MHVDKSSIAFMVMGNSGPALELVTEVTVWELWKQQRAEHHYNVLTCVVSVCPWFSADNGSTSTITSGPQNLSQFEVSFHFTHSRVLPP